MMTLIRRDIALALRQGGDAAIAVIFFVIAAMLFAFGVGPEPQELARIAPGIIWVTALLAALLALDRLFLVDWEDGTLDLIALSPLPLEAAVLAKCVAHWLLTGLPLLVATPLVGVLLHLDSRALPALLAAMALGTPSLSLIGGLGAALTLGARRGGVLVSLLVLPLEIPVLIFGAAAVQAVLSDRMTASPFLLLGAILAGALALCPWGAAAGLRQALE